MEKDNKYILWLNEYKEAVIFLDNYKREKGICEMNDTDWSKLKKNVDKNSALDWIWEQRNIVEKEFNLCDFDKRLSWEQIELLQKVGIVRKREQFTKEEINVLLGSFCDVYWGYKCPVPSKENDIKEDFNKVLKKMAYHLFVYVNNYYYSYKGQNFTFDDYIQEGYLGLINGIKTYNHSCGDYSTYLEKNIFERLREKFYFEDRLFEECIKVVDKKCLQLDICSNNMNDNYVSLETLFSRFRKMDERSSNILRLRILDNLSFQEIGNYYGISKQRVHEIYQGSMKKLTDSLFDNGKFEVWLDSKGEEFSQVVDYYNLVKGNRAKKKIVTDRIYREIEKSYGEKLGDEEKKIVGKVLLRKK